MAARSPARCCSSTRSRAASSRTKRSSARSPEAEPYEEWLKHTQFKLHELPDLPETPLIAASNEPSALLDRQQAFGYTQEDIQFFLEPMAKRGDDPGRLDGHRHADRRALEAAAAALQLFPPELRAGDQPAARCRSAKSW